MLWRRLPRLKRGGGAALPVGWGGWTDPGRRAAPLRPGRDTRQGASREALPSVPAASSPFPVLGCISSALKTRPLSPPSPRSLGPKGRQAWDLEPARGRGLSACTPANSRPATSTSTLGRHQNSPRRHRVLSPPPSEETGPGGHWGALLLLPPPFLNGCQSLQGDPLGGRCISKLPTDVCC